MKQGTRKRKVGIVTPPDVRYIASTPSPNTKRAKPTYSSPSDFRTWDEDDVCDFLEEKGHEDVAATLKANHVTGKSLASLKADDLRKMGTDNEDQISEVLSLLAQLYGSLSNNLMMPDVSPGLHTKVFNDPIHGHIEVHPLCVKIIDTPQFQRLRNIKQLGGCYYVFPGASHNRFEHSIGTSYLAYRLAKNLKKRQPELGITDEDLLCVSIAGLCHDLGHGPFSHMFDLMFIPQARPDSDWKHEDSSVRMFDHLISTNNLQEEFAKHHLDETDLIFIKELIIGPGKDRGRDENWPYKGRTADKSYLYEIVANKRTGIDVDKWDYFARDCHCLGIKNNFDYKRFMKFARVIRVEGKLQICVRDKEANNVYDMFHTRVSLFRRAYQHKTSNIIETMITEAFLKADSHLLFKGQDGRMLKISEAIDDMVAFTQLTDHVYHQILCSSDPKLTESREIIQRIETRQLYKCVGQTILKKQRSEEEIPDICREIADSIPQDLDCPPTVDADDIIVHLVRFDYGMKERNPIDEVRFYSKDNVREAMKYRKDQVSFMLPEYFTEQQMRVYCRRSEPEILQKVKIGFIQWCQGHECTTPKGGDMVVDLTPMKMSQEENPHGQSCVNRLEFKDEVPLL